MSWYLIGLSGALHLGHIDSDGQGTVIEVRNREGAKFWMKATRKAQVKNNSEDPEADRAAALLELANINMFIQFSLQVPDLDYWILEGIFLTNKTRLVMGPDCPHWVYTPFHTICSGGHYIASATIQDTVIGLIHAFMLDNFISNTNHPPTRILLCRLASFYFEGLVKQRYNKHEIAHAHLLDLENFSSVIDLMSFCNLIIFINVLDFKTYMYNKYIEVNNIKELSQERLAAIEAFDFNASVDIIDKQTKQPVKDPRTSLWVPYIAQQASALLLYRNKADKAKLQGAPGSTAATLNRQILLCFQGTFLEDPVNAAIESEHEVFTFLEPHRYDVIRLTSLKAPLRSIFSFCSWTPKLRLGFVSNVIKYHFFYFAGGMLEMLVEPTIPTLKVQDETLQEVWMTGNLSYNSVFHLAGSLADEQAEMNYVRSLGWAINEQALRFPVQYHPALQPLMMAMAQENPSD
ncbi:hypothetical protein GALMADRAFT_148591 [Galerina marginata CBS 339.88]|uniref:Uncharacterized protein n=1 Tax=Galerina marginata (strain CBS 339.88) TaxID=685588 RepID=A0A067S6M7_GALM3|nr:hypothetical protein GALMADRAFT_148591 [Galerina marginata CBS 339.88]